MNTVKNIIENKADRIRTEYIKELTSNLLNNIQNDEVIDEHIGTDLEHRIEELLKQVRYVRLKNDDRKYYIKDISKYDEITLETEIHVFSFNLNDNTENTFTETKYFDYMVDFLNSIDSIKWVEFTKLCKDKTLLKTGNIKGILELMLI